MIKISLNSGHLVGTDPGAVGSGYHEADLVEIAQNETSRILRSEYVLDLEDSDKLYVDDVAEANAFGAHFAIEYHLNSSSNQTSNGFETFIYPNHKESIALQQSLHPKIFDIVKKYGVTARDRGQKSNKDLYYVSGTKMPAIIIEFCFINNKAEADAFSKNAKAIGAELAHAIASACKLPVKNASVQKREYIQLPGSESSWRIYNVSGPYTVGNEIAKLNPAKFGGLEYEVLDWISFKTVAKIKTQQFGEAAIYVGAETGAKVVVK